MVKSSDYIDYVKKLEAKFGSFVLDARAGCTNRSAGLRARKLSTELREDLKNYRSVSLQLERDRKASKNEVISDDAEVSEEPVDETPEAVESEE